MQEGVYRIIIALVLVWLVLGICHRPGIQKTRCCR
jgi:hypothetical protein